MIWVAAINSGTYPYWYFLYNAVRQQNLEKFRNLFSQNFEIKEISLDKDKGIRKLMRDYRINPK